MNMKLLSTALMLAFSLPSLAAEDVLIKKTADHICTLSVEKKKSRLAVQPFTDDKDLESPDSKRYTTQIITLILKCGNLRVIDPAKMKHVLDEQEKGLTGIIDDETAPATGKLLGADAILFGQVDGKSIQIRIVDATTGEILGAKVEEATGKNARITDEKFSDDASKKMFRYEQHRKQLWHLFYNRPMLYLHITGTDGEIKDYRSKYPRKFEKFEERMKNAGREKRNKLARSREYFLDLRQKNEKFNEKIKEGHRALLTRLEKREI